MIKVKLYGNLGKRFGPEWSFSIKNAKEAIKALEANTRGEFSKYLHETLTDKKISYDFVIKGLKAEDEADKALFSMLLNDGDLIEIIPVIGGSGGGVLTFFLVSLVSTAISAALAPSPEIQTGTGGVGEGARKESFLFTGKDAPAKQGNPVPVGYGRMMVPPITISAYYEYQNEYRGSGG